MEKEPQNDPKYFNENKFDKHDSGVHQSEQFLQMIQS